MKKASVSIPIIVAIIALGVVLMYFFSTNFGGVFENKDVVFTNPKTAPVDNLIHACLENSLQNAFNKLGNNGGWLSTEIFEENAKEPTDSFVLPINKNESVAYWYFMVDNNFCDSDCRFGSLAPTLEQIEQQVEEYVRIDVLKCFVDNWNLDENYNVYIKDLPSVDVIITDKNVKADLKFPMDVEKLGEEGLIHREDYSTTLDLPFKKIWQVANEIAAYEASSRFLEVSVLNLISIYSGKDENKLPPMYDVDMFNYNPPVWQASEVREKINEMLTAYLNQITIKDSKDSEFSINAEGERKVFQGLLVWDVQDDAVKDLDIDFYYNPNWQPFISFGNQEGVILPTNLIPADPDQDIFMNLLGIAGFNRYKTIYHLSYPLLVEIKDEDALNGQGYTFRFALEGNIRNNDVLTEDSKVTGFAFDDTISVCDKRFWSGETKIKVVDDDGEPLEGVAVSLYAFNDVCGLGKTNYNGELVTSLPEGIFTIKAHLGGYYLPETKISSNDESITITAYPEKEMDISVGKAEHSFEDVEDKRIKWGFDNFGEKEKGIFTMYNIEAPEYFVVINISGGNTFKTTARLVPGKYKIMSVVFYNDTIEIPDKCILACLKKINGTNLTNYPVSIINVENVEIKADELYNNNILDISIPVLPKPSSYDDLGYVSELSRILSEDPTLFKMRFRSE